MDSIAIATMGKFTGPSKLGTFIPPPPEPKGEEHVFPKIYVKNVKASYPTESKKVEVKSVSEDE